MGEKQIRQKQNENFVYRMCGTNHKCPTFNKPCTKCNKKGHYAKMCRTMKKQDNKQKNRVNATEESSNCEGEIYISVVSGGEKHWTEKIQFTIKLHTGAQYNVLPTHLLDKTKVI